MCNRKSENREQANISFQTSSKLLPLYFSTRFPSLHTSPLNHDNDDVRSERLSQRRVSCDKFFQNGRVQVAIATSVFLPEQMRDVSRSYDTFGLRLAHPHKSFDVKIETRCSSPTFTLPFFLLIVFSPCRSSVTTNVGTSTSHISGNAR